MRFKAIEGYIANAVVLSQSAQPMKGQNSHLYGTFKCCTYKHLLRHRSTFFLEPRYSQEFKSSCEEAIVQSKKPPTGSTYFKRKDIGAT